MRVSIAVATTALLFAASPVMATTCSTVAACVLGQNNSTGASSDVGVEGISKRGFGLVGITLANPSKTAPRVAGLYGKDQGPGPFNSGVSAYSINGTGLTAFSVHGTGVIGTTAQNISTYPYQSGVLGIDTSGINLNSGVTGQSTKGTGVSALSTDGTGITGESENGVGILAASYMDDGLDVQSGLYGIGLNLTSASDESAVQLEVTGEGAFITGYRPEDDIMFQENALEFYIDAQGDEYLAGQLTTSGGTYARTRSTGGSDVAAYGARTASPSLEDFGQGTLRAGAGHVTLDPKFASTIDTRSYLVFITPRGDSHGLYTTAVGAKGFDVRESEHGTSSLSFDYRIVGRPIDMATAARLPAIGTLPQFSATANMHRRFKPVKHPNGFKYASSPQQRPKRHSFGSP